MKTLVASPMDEIKKSINSILYERVTSPLYGTFIISWAIWNWKIIYLTIFISQDKIEGTKIEYITSHYYDYCNLVVWPLVSTIVLIGLFPFISNRAYWLSLIFKKWRTDKRNTVQRTQLLTVEQSINLMEQIKNADERFEEILENKNLEIQQLTLQLAEANKKASQIPRATTSKPPKEEVKVSDDYIKNFFVDKENLERFGNVVLAIQYTRSLLSSEFKVDSKFLSYLEGNDIVIPTGNGRYKFTEVGKQYQRVYASIDR